MIKRFVSSVCSLAALLALATPAHAVTDCGLSGTALTVSTLWVGPPDGLTASTAGGTYITTSSGLAFSLTVSDPNLKNVVATALLSVANHNAVGVRFAGTGVSCTSGARTDVLGMYVMPNAN